MIPASGAGGPGFDPRNSPDFERCALQCWLQPVRRWGTGALLAQWLERAAVNRKVTGSIPVGSVALGKGGDGVRVHRRLVGQHRVYSSAVERLTADQQVPGSNPGVPFCRVA